MTITTETPHKTVSARAPQLLPDDLNELSSRLAVHLSPVALTPLAVHHRRLALVLVVPDLVERVVERLHADHAAVCMAPSGRHVSGLLTHFEL